MLYIYMVCSHLGSSSQAEWKRTYNVKLATNSHCSSSSLSCCYMKLIKPTQHALHARTDSKIQGLSHALVRGGRWREYYSNATLQAQNTSTKPIPCRPHRPSGHSTCPCTGCTSGAAIAHARLHDNLHTWGTLRPTLHHNHPGPSISPSIRIIPS